MAIAGQASAPMNWKDAPRMNWLSFAVILVRSRGVRTIGETRATPTSWATVAIRNDTPVTTATFRYVGICFSLCAGCVSDRRQASPGSEVLQGPSDQAEGHESAGRARQWGRSARTGA